MFPYSFFFESVYQLPNLTTCQSQSKYALVTVGLRGSRVRLLI